MNLLGNDPFIVVNGDIWCDYNFSRLPRNLKGLAHLVMVDNPEHNAQGDFSLQDDGKLATNGTNKLTFSGIGVYHPELFKNIAVSKQPLAPLLRQAMQKGMVNGEKYSGEWLDIGTPERLDELNQRLS